jgi:hypothetical protein
MRLFNFVFPFISGIFESLHLQIFVVAPMKSEHTRPINWATTLLINLKIGNNEMPPDEHYFGLGGKARGFDRRGAHWVMRNRDPYTFNKGFQTPSGCSGNVES